MTAPCDKSLSSVRSYSWKHMFYKAVLIRGVTDTFTEIENFAILTPRYDILSGRNNFLLCWENSFDRIKHNFQSSECPKIKKLWNIMKKWAQTHAVDSFRDD